MDSWKSHNIHQSWTEEQLKWTAEVTQYVQMMWNNTRQQAKSSNIFKSGYRPLSCETPLYGPRFVPPTYLDAQKRSNSPEINPETMYLKPITVIHPFYFPGLATCPRCRGYDIKWEGWTTSGSRDVHGVAFDELAIGFQLRCNVCEKLGKQTSKKRDIQYCWSTTSTEFWSGFQDFEIPRMWPVPY